MTSEAQEELVRRLVTALESLPPTPQSDADRLSALEEKVEELTKAIGRLRRAPTVNLHWTHGLVSVLTLAGDEVMRFLSHLHWS